MNFHLDNKVKSSLFTAAIFFAVAQPTVYRYTNGYFNDMTECPTLKTRLLHTVVFFLVSLFIMIWLKDNLHITEKAKLYSKYAFYGALLFFFLSSAELYNLTNSVLGLNNNITCPAQSGIILHTGAYALILYGLMHLD